MCATTNATLEWLGNKSAAFQQDLINFAVKEGRRERERQMEWEKEAKEIERQRMMMKVNEKEKRKERIERNIVEKEAKAAGRERNTD